MIYYAIYLLYMLLIFLVFLCCSEICNVREICNDTGIPVSSAHWFYLLLTVNCQFIVRCNLFANDMTLWLANDVFGQCHVLVCNYSCTDDEYITIPGVRWYYEVCKGSLFEQCNNMTKGWHSLLALPTVLFYY